MRVSLVLLAALTLTMTGCFEAKTLITVNTDGSGTIETTMFMPDMNMGPGGAGANAKKAEPDPNEIKESAEAAAKALGEGVTVKSAEPAKHADGRQGSKIVFAFTDINKVKPTLMPNMKGPGMDANEDQSVKFEFTKGRVAKLVITMPPMKKDKTDAEEPNDPQQQAMQDMMMAKMFKGLLIDLSVKVNGTISKTDATFVNDKKDTVILVHEDLDAASNDPALIKKLKPLFKLDPKEAMKEISKDEKLKTLIQAETNEKVTIEFK